MTLKHRISTADAVNSSIDECEMDGKTGLQSFEGMGNGCSSYLFIQKPSTFGGREEQA